MSDYNNEQPEGQIVQTTPADQNVETQVVQADIHVEAADADLGDIAVAALNQDQPADDQGNIGQQNADHEQQQQQQQQNDATGGDSTVPEQAESTNEAGSIPEESGPGAEGGPGEDATSGSTSMAQPSNSGDGGEGLEAREDETRAADSGESAATALLNPPMVIPEVTVSSPPHSPGGIAATTTSGSSSEPETVKSAGSPSNDASSPVPAETGQHGDGGILHETVAPSCSSDNRTSTPEQKLKHDGFCGGQPGQSPNANDVETVAEMKRTVGDVSTGSQPSSRNAAAVATSSDGGEPPQPLGPQPDRPVLREKSPSRNPSSIVIVEEPAVDKQRVASAPPGADEDTAENLTEFDRQRLINPSRGNGASDGTWSGRARMMASGLPIFLMTLTIFAIASMAMNIMVYMENSQQSIVTLTANATDAFDDVSTIQSVLFLVACSIDALLFVVFLLYLVFRLYNYIRLNTALVGVIQVVGVVFTVFFYVFYTYCVVYAVSSLYDPNVDSARHFFFKLLLAVSIIGMIKGAILLLTAISAIFERRELLRAECGGYRRLDDEQPRKRPAAAGASEAVAKEEPENENGSGASKKEQAAARQEQQQAQPVRKLSAEKRDEPSAKPVEWSKHQ